jgi:hypothetical protein
MSGFILFSPTYALGVSARTGLLVAKASKIKPLLNNSP